MAKNLKLSQWHDWRVKPVHIGVYQRCKEEKSFSYWDGKEWFCLADNVESAVRFFNCGMKTFFNEEKWRGIVK